jgi:hypothetical protein
MSDPTQYNPARLALGHWYYAPGAYPLNAVVWEWRDRYAFGDFRKVIEAADRHAVFLNYYIVQARVIYEEPHDDFAEIWLSRLLEFGVLIGCISDCEKNKLFAVSSVMQL